MSKPSLRRTILERSVAELLDDDESVGLVVMMTTRHRWFVPYAILSGAMIFLVATATGMESLLNRGVLAACGIAVAGMATTEHTVLAETDRGLVLLRSSRIRQYAKAVLRRLPADRTPTMVGSTVITSDWRVDGVIYTLTKRWEAAMREIAISGGDPAGPRTDRRG